MNGWKQDKRWSDKFLPDIKRILGEHLIAEPPMEEDTERNTDLIVLRMEPLRIACRVRKYQYYSRYPNEFTIRSSRPSGAKTELTKIIEGWGDYLFYGFCDDEEKRLVAWTLCDLRVFRLWFQRHLLGNQGNMPGLLQKNGDGSSQFRAFDIADLPGDFVFARETAATREQHVPGRPAVPRRHHIPVSREQRRSIDLSS